MTAHERDLSLEAPGHADIVGVHSRDPAPELLDGRPLHPFVRRRSKAALGELADRFRPPVLVSLPQNDLRLFITNFEIGWKGDAERGEVDVEEWCPQLQAVSHRGPI